MAIEKLNFWNTGDNPWRQLSADGGEYLLPEDKDKVQEWNASHPAELQFKTELVPNPFAGDPNAPIWIVNQNPGYNPTDEQDFRELASNRETALRQLAFGVDHLYYLDACFDHNTSKGAYGFWNTHLVESKGKGNCLFDILCPNATAEERRGMAQKKFFTLDLFGYHSIRFGFDRKLVEQFASQAAFFTAMLKKAMQEGKVLMFCREAFLRRIMALDAELGTRLEAHGRAHKIIVGKKAQGALYITKNNLKLYGGGPEASAIPAIRAAFG